MFNPKEALARKREQLREIDEERKQAYKKAAKTFVVGGLVIGIAYVALAAIEARAEEEPQDEDESEEQQED